MQTVLAMLLCGIVASPAFAELRYTVRLETRKVASAAALDPKLTAIGARILEAVVPESPLEMTIVAGDRVARVTWNRALPGLPAGAVLIQRTNGSRIVLDPARQVYWRVPMPDATSLPARDRPVVTPAGSPTPDIVAGHPAMRSPVDVSIPFPEARDGMLVTGTPTNLPLRGEIWVTDSFGAYATRQLRAIHGLPLMGLEVAPGGKLVLRQVLRGPLFGDIEFESIVVAMIEEDLPDTLFVAPPGFKEIPAPRIRR